jgi:hypothetical protein
MRLVAAVANTARGRTVKRWIVVLHNFTSPIAMNSDANLK